MDLKSSFQAGDGDEAPLHLSQGGLDNQVFTENNYAGNLSMLLQNESCLFIITRSLR